MSEIITNSKIIGINGKPLNDTQKPTAIRKKPSRIIVIEGADGSGKETQSKMLYRALIDKGEKVKLFSFPNYESMSSGPVRMYLNGLIGKDHNSLDPSQASALYGADRFCTLKNANIDKLIEEDYTIIMDRYVESNIIYQCASTNANGQMIKQIIDTVMGIEYGLYKLPFPRMVVYLDLLPEISQKLIDNRNEKKDIHEKDKELLIKVREYGCGLAEGLHWNVVNCTNVDKTDIRSKDEIHNKIMSFLK